MRTDLTGRHQLGTIPVHQWGMTAGASVVAKLPLRAGSSGTAGAAGADTAADNPISNPAVVTVTVLGMRLTKTRGASPNSVS